MSLPWVSNLSVNVPSATSSISCNSCIVSVVPKEAGVQKRSHLQPPCIDGSEMDIIMLILLPKLLETSL